MSANDPYTTKRAQCLPEIFRIFGLTWTPGNDANNARVAYEAFKGPTYGQINVPCSQSQADAARKLLVVLGFARPALPNQRNFRNTYCFSPGITTDLAALRLLQNMHTNGYELGTVHLLGGQRRLTNNDSNPATLLKILDPNIMEHPWAKGLPWDQPYNNWDLTEFHVRVAMVLALNPGLTCEPKPALDTMPMHGTPERTVQEALLQRHNGDLIIVQNAPAVPTTTGDQALVLGPTTTSCIEELIRNRPVLLHTGEPALIVSGDSHPGRVFHDLRQTLDREDRWPYLHYATGALAPNSPEFVRTSLHRLATNEYLGYLKK